MTGTRGNRLGALVLAVVLAGSVLAPAPVAAGSSGNAGRGADTNASTYHLTQGGRCLPVTPLSGSQSAAAFYDYGVGETDYSSAGTTALQRENTSELFLYRDGNGTVSLVVLHGKTGGGVGGGAATLTFDGLPAAGAWTVRDDQYPRATNYDRWHTTATPQRVDWTWAASRTDGGVFESLGGDADVRITPAFNEDATLYGTHYAGTVDDWQLLSGDRFDPDRYSLAMDEPVTIASGPCPTSGGGHGPDYEYRGYHVNRTPAVVGDPVEVNVTLANVGGATGTYTGLLNADFDGVDMTDVAIPAGETRNLTFVTTFDEPGSYDLREHAEFLGSLRVVPEPTPSSTVTRRGDGTVDVVVRDAPAGAVVGATLPTADATDSATVANVSVEPADATDRLPFTVRPRSFSGDDALPALPSGHRPVGAWTLAANGADGHVANATVTVTADESALDGDARDVAAYRRNATTGNWTRTALTAVGVSNATREFEVRLSAFGTLALAEPVADAAVESVTASPSTATVGDATAVTVTAMVTNGGAANATVPLTLTVDGDPVATRNVTVGADSQRAVSFTQHFERAGDHRLTVGNRTTTVTVENASTPADAAEDRPANETATRTTTNGFGPGFTAVTAIAAALVAGLAALVLRRRSTTPA
ncbi:MAG: hypothetical protein ABEJ31_05060 [Haloarculaceae archaeon]